MEERRGRGRSRESGWSSYRYDRPPEPAEPPQWRMPAARPTREQYASSRKNPPGRYEPPRGGDEGRTPRGRSRDPSGGRSPTRSEVSRRTEQRSAEYSLGRTAGVAAAGAWAARQEVASLLRARCSPDTLVSLIERGEEGPHVLNFAGSDAPKFPRRKSPSPDKSWSKVESEKRSSALERGSATQELFSDDDDWDKDVEKQRAILESLVPPSGEVTPVWASRSSGSGVEKKKAPQTRVIPVQLPEGVGFKKKASPPEGYSFYKSARPESDRKEGLEDIKFKTPATRPPKTAPEERDEPPARSRSRRRERCRRRKEEADTMAGRESGLMRQYQEGCEGVYNWMRRLGFEMELTKILEEKGPMDKERFKSLTKPNRVATGLNYVRLMTRLFEWRFRQPSLDSRSGALDGRMGVLEFVEHLISCQVGYLTPRSLLYALDFFGTLFGFDPKGSYWGRAKKLVTGYAQSKTDPPSRAPAFCRATMKALEECVTDTYLQKPVRVACGKLRLSIQSSTRYDDVLNTPVSCCEWIRRPGSKGIIGLRSRAIRGKCGPRLWVASLKGVSPENDSWLIELMKLILESHGSSWKTDDHMGKAANSDGSGFASAPSRLEDDVALVKEDLKKMAADGLDTGLTSKGIEELRWHGAKATLTSIMQHLHLKKREVRFQGSWREKGESMPDTYLREGQTIVLGAQEKCLAYLRGGGDIFILEGVQVKPGETPEVDPEEKARVDRAMECGVPDGAAASDLPKAFLDGAFGDGWKISDDVLEAEKVEIEKAEIGTTFTDEVEPSEAGNLEEELASVNLELPTDLGEDGAWGEIDTEGFTAHWVISKAASGPPKLHLTAPLVWVEGVLQEARPKCGLSGQYDYVKSEEAWDDAATLCRRCSTWTEGSCPGICEQMRLGKDLVVKRCTRRCSLAPGHKCQGGRDHRCSFHSEPEAEAGEAGS